MQSVDASNGHGPQTPDAKTVIPSILHDAPPTVTPVCERSTTPAFGLSDPILYI
jgi:hypothetical protein